MPLMDKLIKKIIADTSTSMTKKIIDEEARELIENIVNDINDDENLTNDVIREILGSLRESYEIIINTSKNEKGRITVTSWYSVSDSCEKD